MKHTPKPTWILIANASKGFCFESVHGKPKLNLLARYEDPLGRAKGIELGDDRGGHESMGHGRGSGTYSPRTDARTKEHDNFARELAKVLNDGIAAHHCEALAIFASNPFLGEIKSHLSEQAMKALGTASATDLTSFDQRELTRRVDQALRPLS
ncbi:host attachment protein [Piscinibacter sp.]|jgi:protein required for attachment to host cells|uniref:host attachment protein n=1 Tax=Piscinibacter sp. TaxID=1903157 RepID=UPI002F3F8E85